MKVFFILMRIITVGLVWSLFFLEGVRVIMLKNWRFDIIRAEHWEYAKDLWLSGWVISDAKEWAFVLILLTFIPLWLTGWAALSMVSYSKFLYRVLALPLRLFQSTISSKTRQVADKLAKKTVVKKKSYKEIRPKSLDGSTSSDARTVKSFTQSPNLKRSAPPSKAPAAVTSPVKKSSSFEHSLFDFDDDDDDFNFDLDAPVKAKAKPEPVKNTPKESPNKQEKQLPKEDNKKQKNKPKENPNKQEKQLPKEANKNNTSSILEVIKDKGYDFISAITIKSSLVDFIGFSQDKIIVFLVDKERGDWLADEEKFNGEEPLWFSENSHRISPVRKVDVIREAVVNKLDGTSFSQEVEAFVVNQMNNIINAEDMLDIWKELDVKVARIDRGSPKELMLLGKALEDADAKMSKEEADKLKKLLRSIN
ncbi:MAG: hypothetical protein R3Y43_05890 [Alphaproteobacteria bacterium]